MATKTKIPQKVKSGVGTSRQVCASKSTPCIIHVDDSTYLRATLMGERFTYRHIKGHQDREGNTLDFLAKLNVHVDKLAGVAGINERVETTIDASILQITAANMP
jgi:hypothetical protein